MSGSIPSLSAVSNNKVHSEELPTAWGTKPKQPKDFSVLAFIVTVLFNHICGFFAYHFNEESNALKKCFIVSAKHSWHLHDYKKARRHSKYAVALIILGIIIGLATYALAFSLYFTLHENKACSDGQSYDNNSGINNINGQTKCCQYDPSTNPFGSNQGSRVLDMEIELYCSSSGDGPIYPDSNGQYSSCCSQFGCIFQGVK
ncbi:unnamed protein product [Mytilus coruscus]|uniref:Uncharacterized protein n=1 Tax=Mytilus coruscus TaxID=42192 RepID=A0A6J8CYE9_MYTCO|nr:unnamed protein product [Mytilus coruscus]